jgi:hypothetical protein
MDNDWVDEALVFAVPALAFTFQYFVSKSIFGWAPILPLFIIFVISPPLRIYRLFVDELL